MLTVAEVLTELTEAQVLPALPEVPAVDIDWTAVVAEWMSEDPEEVTEDETTEDEPATVPAEDYSYRARGC